MTSMKKITHILTKMWYYAKRDRPGDLLDLTISQQINRPGSMIVKISLAQGYRIWLLWNDQIFQINLVKVCWLLRIPTAKILSSW